MAYNFNKYAYTYCITCIWSCTGGYHTQCDIADNCTACDNYNHELACCKCREKASDEAKCPYYKENKMIVFDARMIYDEYKRQCLIKEDRFFTGENHHWMLRFHKCLQEEMENAGFICDKSWLNAIKPGEVRTETDNIKDLDRGTFKW